MKRTGIALVGGLLTLSALLTACGSEDPPSKDDLASKLTDAGGLDAKAAGCVAGKLLDDDDLSAEQLNAIADDDRSSLSDDDAQEVIDAVGTATAGCLGG